LSAELCPDPLEELAVFPQTYYSWIAGGIPWEDWRERERDRSDRRQISERRDGKKREETGGRGGEKTSRSLHPLT